MGGPLSLREHPALFTDLYELTMLQAYWSEGMTGRAVFSLHVRRLPARRNYLIACGLSDALRYLRKLRFAPDDLEFLSGLGPFRDEFLRWLQDFRFTGDVHAVPEGTPVFAQEPLLEVEAPIAEGQLVETYLMNQVHLQTLLASKAARIVRAAAGRPVVDFGLRRIHGADAGLKAARAFHIAGVASTSNVLAGRVYGVPTSGTMAHSYVQAHDSELEAFRRFAELYPETTLLVDTYDSIAGVERVVELAHELGDAFRVGAVRLDSGDLADLARRARAILDAAGLDDVRIFASGGLDENGIAGLLGQGAPIDGFGVGSHMGASSDAPVLDIAYKLTEYGGRGRIKLSPEKVVYPGRKQIFRFERGGRATGDVVAAAAERVAGRPLLRAVMSEGELLAGADEPLDRIRARAADELARLPGHLLALEPAIPPYPVEISRRLRERRRALAAEHTGADPDGR